MMNGNRSARKGIMRLEEALIAFSPEFHDKHEQVRLEYMKFGGFNIGAFLSLYKNYLMDKLTEYMDSETIKELYWKEVN